MLIRRWSPKKTNLRLKRRIDRLTAEAEQYAKELCARNWDDICDRMQGGLGTKETWHLIRHLIDPTKSKYQVSQVVQKILHLDSRTDDQILDSIKNKYIGQCPAAIYAE